MNPSPLLAASLLAGPLSSPPPPRSPDTSYRAQARIRQVLARPPSDPVFVEGAFVLEEGGRIRHLFSRAGHPLELGDGRPTRALALARGWLYRQRGDRLEVMDLPGAWSPARLPGDMAIAGLHARGGWVQAEDGTVLGLPVLGEEDPWVLGRLPRLTATGEDLLACEDGTLHLIEARRIARTVRLPAPATRVARARNALPSVLVLDAAGELHSLDPRTDGGPPRRVRTLRTVVDLVADPSQGRPAFLALDDAGSLLGIDPSPLFFPGDLVCRLDRIPGARGLTPLPPRGYGPWDLVLEVAPGIVQVAEVPARDPRARTRQALFRRRERLAAVR